MVAVLDNIQDGLGAWPKRQIIRIGKLAGTSARPAPAADEHAVGGEDLDAVVAGVGQVEIAVRPERHSADTGELADLRAGAAPAFDELPLGIELGDALVVAELRERSDERRV